MKGHDVLAHVDRNERRFLLASEARARKSGDWGPWERLTFPPRTISDGWAGEFTIAHRNKVFAVLERTVAGGVIHYAVTSLSHERPSWWEMQRIKDELAGKEATAVEVYPPHAEIVDSADMYHIWVMPGGLPFIFPKTETAP
jgi:hypothetical protein